MSDKINILKQNHEQKKLRSERKDFFSKIKKAVQTCWSNMSLSVNANSNSYDFLGVTLLVSCIVALAVVSRLNRKVMLVASILTMGICHIVLGICFHVQENELRPETNSLGGQEVTTSASAPPPDVLATTSTVAPISTTLPGGEHDHRPGLLGWLPIVTVVIFLFMGNIGYGTLIWVVTGKLLILVRWR